VYFIVEKNTAVKKLLHTLGKAEYLSSFSQSVGTK